MNQRDSQPVVMVLDDDRMVRTALARLLQLAGYTVQVFGTVADFLERLDEDQSGCLVADLRLAGFSGLDLIPLLQARERTLPIVFISGYGDIPTSVRAMRAGAIDFLTKPVEEEALLDAVSRALERDAVARREAAITRELRDRHARLTRREREVFALVVQGLLNKQVAACLGTTQQTVKVHRARVMQKFQVTSLAQLVHCAERLERGGSASVSTGKAAKDILAAVLAESPIAGGRF
jgi:FixJ family two-component response regulator